MSEIRICLPADIEALNLILEALLARWPDAVCRGDGNTLTIQLDPGESS